MQETISSALTKNGIFLRKIGGSYSNAPTPVCAAHGCCYKLLSVYWKILYFGNILHKLTFVCLD